MGSKNLSLMPAFCANRSDDSHCLQASVMMVLATLKKKCSWKQIDRLTGYDIRYYSWSTQGAIMLSDSIAGTQLWSDIDYKKFALQGAAYLRQHYRSRTRWLALQKKNASPGFVREKQAAQAAVDRDIVHTKRLRQSDIESLLHDHLLIALVDYGKFMKGAKSEGHFVVVFGKDSKHFILHDPGLPPRPNLRIAKKAFMRAFEHDLIAVPLRKS